MKPLVFVDDVLTFGRGVSFRQIDPLVDGANHRAALFFRFAVEHGSKVGNEVLDHEINHAIHAANVQIDRVINAALVRS